MCGRERRLVARTRERHAAVHELLGAGRPLAAIGRILHLDRKTVQRFAREPDVVGLLVKTTSRETKLDVFKPYLNQRWNEGITSAAGSTTRSPPRASLAACRPSAATSAPSARRPAPPAPAVPETRQITRWLLSYPDHLQPDEQAQLDAIRARCPHLDALAGHVTAFAKMMTSRSGDRDLEGWLIRVEAGDHSGLRSFAAGIRRDQQAVTNGLTLPYSSPPAKAASRASRCSNGKCTAAPDSTCSASASSFTPRERHHGIRARAELRDRPQSPGRPERRSQDVRSA